MIYVTKVFMNNPSIEEDDEEMILNSSESDLEKKNLDN